LGYIILPIALYITMIVPTTNIVLVIIAPNTEYLVYPYVYWLSGFFFDFFSSMYDIPILMESPKSCIESDIIAILFVNMPPII
jgi:hypothetical protein